MPGNSKIIGVPFKLWWSFFLVLQVCLVFLIIGSMVSKNWVYSKNDRVLRNPSSRDSENNIYYGYKFAGGLSKCTRGCTVDYQDLADDWCSYYRDVKEKFQNTEVEEIKDPYLSVCAMFYSLWIGKLVYVAFECGGIACAFFWAVGMCCYCLKKKMLNFSFFCAGAFWTCHYIGFIVYIELTRSSITNNCQNFESGGKRPKLCIDEGPMISLAVLITLPIIVISYCIIGCLFKKRLIHPQHDRSSEELSKPAQVSNIDQDLSVYNLDMTNTYNLQSPHKIYKEIDVKPDAPTPDLII
jgi:hypothetical protein